jgi:spermidine/putrescine transport system permease protein
LRNSVFIALGVVALAVPIGLAGALILTQVSSGLRAFYYTVVISPILVPGVVLGISTLLFWDRIGYMLGFSRESLFYNGFFLTIIGQSTFISAYTMLIFISRLQRFDTVQEEAALDLGATHVQTFRKILLPFLKPAIGSASVLAFLASFENYNTTVFTIVSESTLTTVLASKVRYGINPSISALAVVIVALTLFLAAMMEVKKRRELASEKISAKIAKGELREHGRSKPFFVEPVVILILLTTLGGLATVYMSGTIGVEECKVAVKEQKRIDTEKRIRALEQKRMFKNAAPSDKVETPDQKEKTRAKGTEGYENLFSPQSLETTQPEDSSGTDEIDADSGDYNNIFAPENLQQKN